MRKISVRFVSVALLAFAGAAALSGCGSGGGGTQDSGNFATQFPTRFSVVQDPNTHDVIFRGMNNGILTQDAAFQLINADLLNTGGSSFTIFDTTSQQFDPAFPSGTGRYMVTVQHSGTQTNPTLRYRVQDNFNPTVTIDPFIVTSGMTGTGLIDTSNQFLIQNGFSTNAGIAGATAFSSLGNADFVWLSNHSGSTIHID